MKNEIGKKLHKDRNEIISFSESFSTIYVYGAGNIASKMLEYLEEEEIKCAGIIVSDQHRESATFNGLKVYEFSEIEYDDSIGIILALSPANQNEVMKNISAVGTINLNNIYGQKLYNGCNRKPYSGGKKIVCRTSLTEGYFSEYRDLDNIGKMFNTDKNSDYHNYLNKYEFFLSKFRDKEMNVLELGVYKGASIAMWEKFFSKAIIYGVDINPECKIYEMGRKKIIIEDLSHEDRIKKLADTTPQIIIDDASHLWSHQIKALYELLPCLPSGGVYILEDLGTSFGHWTDQFGDANISAYDFLSVILEVVTSGQALRLDCLSYDLYLLKDEIEYLASQIEMMCFIEESCIIIKK